MAHVRNVSVKSLRSTILIHGSIYDHSGRASAESGADTILGSIPPPLGNKILRISADII